MKSQARNLNPIPEAVIAMNLWGPRYSQQAGGSMDFWDSLRPAEQDRCRELLTRIREADKAHGGQR